MPADNELSELLKRRNKMNEDLEEGKSIERKFVKGKIPTVPLSASPVEDKELTAVLNRRNKINSALEEGKPVERKLKPTNIPDDDSLLVGENVKTSDGELTAVLNRRNEINDALVEGKQVEKKFVKTISSSKLESMNDEDSVPVDKELCDVLNRRNEMNVALEEGKNVQRKFIKSNASIYAEFSEFTKRQIQEYEKKFKKYNESGNGALSLSELKIMMEHLNAPQTHISLKNMIKEIDEDGDGALSFREFMVIFRKAQAQELDDDSGLGQLAHLTEVDVDKIGVGGAKSFFEAKISEVSKKSKYEEDVKEEQDQIRRELETKKILQKAFKERAALFKGDELETGSSTVASIDIDNQNFDVEVMNDTELICPVLDRVHQTSISPEPIEDELKLKPCVEELSDGENIESSNQMCKMKKNTKHNTFKHCNLTRSSRPITQTALKLFNSSLTIVERKFPLRHFCEENRMFNAFKNLQKYVGTVSRDNSRRIKDVSIMFKAHEDETRMLKVKWSSP